MHSERHYLTPLFNPQHIAIIGASERPGSVGETLIRNMLEGGYKGTIHPVNPRHQTLFGLTTYPTVEAVPAKVDIAALCIPVDRVPALLESCGRAGVKFVVIITAGFGETGPEGIAKENEIREIARRYRMRLLGPNCLGLLRTANGMNLTFAKSPVHSGSIGLISQSGALCTAIMDWAWPNKVGFSNIVSVGTEADIDFGEVLDYLVCDPQTEHIFLYIEGIRNARRFLSALRTAARVKPVLLIKVGRNRAGSEAALSHTGATIGEDDVFDAALRRSGVVRLHTVYQMYDAASALFLHFHPHGNRLAVITNGGGPGAMAADHAEDIGIPMAELSPETIERLNRTLPAHWSQRNPLDIIGDAPPARYAETLTACLEDKQVDGVLVILTPQAMSDPTEAARQVIDVARRLRKPVLTCWMGQDQVEESRRLFASAGIPWFRTPEPAVEMFSHISSYYRNQKLLVQTPASITADHAEPLIESARLLIETALAEGRYALTPMESKALLSAFHIPIAQALVAHSPDQAVELATELGLPVVMKVVSSQIAHKADIGGVRLNLATAGAVRLAYQQIIDEVREHSPEAEINGISVEPMVHKPNGHEMRIGIIQDPIFGPAITLRVGKSKLEGSKERVIAFPPLNSFLVQDIFASYKQQHRVVNIPGQGGFNEQALESVILRFSEMICELPWLETASITPLIVDGEGAVAVDARITLKDVQAGARPYEHMAIHPYPAHLQHEFVTKGGIRVAIRPIRPEDATLAQDFVHALSPESRYMRFMNSIRELSPIQLHRLTQIDYDREVALLAVTHVDGEDKEVGVVRYASNPDGASCEFAIVVADDWQGKGLARYLMNLLIKLAKERGYRYMTGDFLAENTRMLKFVATLGFKLQTHPDDPGLRHGTLELNP